MSFVLFLSLVSFFFLMWKGAPELEEVGRRASGEEEECWEQNPHLYTPQTQTLTTPTKNLDTGGSSSRYPS